MFLFINMSMTADGKIASANRKVSTFGSRLDHDHLLELRSTADAVMAGARTVDLNPVNLGPGPQSYRQRRLARGLAEYNLRIIVSRTASISPRAEIFQHRFSPILILTTRRATQRKIKRLKSLGAEVKICGEREINFRLALRWLEQRGVRRLLCEGGGELNDALFRAGLVDELHLTLCPRIIGGREAPTIADGHGASNLAMAAPLRLKSARMVGRELFLIYRAGACQFSRGFP